MKDKETADYIINYTISSYDKDFIAVNAIVDKNPGLDNKLYIDFNEVNNLVEIRTLFNYNTDQAYCNEKIKSIQFPSQLRAINPSAFIRLGVDELKFPALINFIGERAFLMCKNLKFVDFSNSINLKILPTNCFGRCMNLESVILPPKLLQIDDHCFYKCHKLDNVVIPEKVRSIKDGAFRETKTSKVIFLGPKPKLETYSVFSGRRVNRVAYVRKKYIEDYKKENNYIYCFKQILPIESYQLVTEDINKSSSKIVARVDENGINTYSGKIEIPEFLYIDNKKRKITEIDRFAFWDCDVKEIIVPKHIKTDNLLVNPDVKIITV